MSGVVVSLALLSVDSKFLDLGKVVCYTVTIVASRWVDALALGVFACHREQRQDRQKMTYPVERHVRSRIQHEAFLVPHHLD